MYKFSENFKELSREILKAHNLEVHIEALVNLIMSDDASTSKIAELLKENCIIHIEDIKLELLDLLIIYANSILADNFISEEEANNFKALKKLFKIREGDFLTHKKFDVREILIQQFIRLFSDNFIDEREAIEKVALQELFDLSYDQFEEFQQDQIIISLMQGANPKDLDISSLPKSFKFA